ncbi:MAG TPA: JAB domain-containing protein [Acidimicrobiales bacterium]
MGDQDVQVCVTKPRKPTFVSVSDPAQVCQLLRGARYRDRESFFTVSLNSQNEVLGVEEVARGTVNGVDIHPREVFKGPIINGAVAIVVAHNHPSGRTSPSNEDVDLTRRLKEAGRVVGIPVLDHLIVAGEDGCYSFAEKMPSALDGARRARKPRRRRR